MKVKDLIYILQTYNPDLPVVNSGYEGGVNEITFHSEETIALNVNGEWYYGPHEVVSEDDAFNGYERMQAVYIR